MADELRFKVTGDGTKDAAKDVADLAAAVGKLEGKKVDVTLDAKDLATKAVDDLNRKLDGLTADEVEVALVVDNSVAEGQVKALRDDLAKLDADDPTVEIKLAKLAETEAQLDAVRGKIASLDDAATGANSGGQLASVKDGLAKVEEGSGKAQGAVHSFAGAAVGDFAATQTGLGPLGEAVGQLTEGVLGGEVAFKELGTAALGAIGIGAGIQVVNKIMGEFAKTAQRAAEIKAFRSDEVDGFTKSLRDGTDAVEDFVTKAEQAGKLGGVSIVGPVGTSIKTDLLGPLADAGASVEAYAQAITGGQAKLDAFTAAIKASGVSADTQNGIISAAKNAAADYGAAQEKAANFTKLFGESTEAANAKAAASQTAEAASAKVSQDAHDKLTSSLQDSADQLQSNIDKNNELAGSFQDSADATLDLADKQQAAADAIAAYDKDVTEETKSTAELAAELRDVARAAKSSADAAVDLQVAQDKANGITTTATAKFDLLNQSLLDQANKATPAARQAILDYISSTNGIPAEKATAIKAAVDAGDLATAVQLLDDASAARPAVVKADADQAALDATQGKLDSLSGTAKVTAVPDGFADTLLKMQTFLNANPLTVALKQSGDYSTRGARMAGGNVTAGQAYTVGEGGRELFVSDSNGEVLNNATTERLLALIGGGSGGTIVNNHLTQNVVVPRGYREQDAGNAVHRLKRRSGSLYAAI